MRISTDRNITQFTQIVRIEIPDEDLERCPVQILRSFGEAESVSEALDALSKMADWLEAEQSVAATASATIWAEAKRDVVVSGAFQEALSRAFKQATDITTRVVQERLNRLPVFTPELIVPHEETRFFPAQKEPLMLRRQRWTNDRGSTATPDDDRR